MAQKQGGSKKSTKDKQSRKSYHSQGHRMENKIRHILANSGEKGPELVASYKKAFAGRS